MFKFVQIPFKMKKIVPVFLIIFTFISSYAQEKTDKKLQLKLNELVKGFNGDVGIYVKNLKTGKAASINADTIFPTASMIKVPITCGLFN